MDLQAVHYLRLLLFGEHCRRHKGILEGSVFTLKVLLFEIWAWKVSWSATSTRINESTSTQRIPPSCSLLAFRASVGCGWCVEAAHWIPFVIQPRERNEEKLSSRMACLASPCARIQMARFRWLDSDGILAVNFAWRIDFAVEDAIFWEPFYRSLRVKFAVEWLWYASSPVAHSRSLRQQILRWSLCQFCSGSQKPNCTSPGLSDSSTSCTCTSRGPMFGFRISFLHLTSCMDKALSRVFQLGVLPAIVQMHFVLDYCTRDSIKESMSSNNVGKSQIVLI